MRKIFSFVLMVGLMFSSQIQCLDKDGFTVLECTLVPVEGKSHAIPKQLSIAGPVIQEEADSNSLNWSGYSAFTGTPIAPNPTYNSVTQASGSWTVPSVTPNPNGDTYSAAWAGIDGYVNSVVEQIGTEHDVIGGQPNYFAWFEMYPAPLQIIEGFPVQPGDVIEGKVSYQGQNEEGNDGFRLTIKNHTKKVKFSIVQYTLPGNPAHLSSANWIVEAPAISVSNSIGILPLANFNTISFNNCKATINHHAGSIDNPKWTFDAITMQSGSTIKAVPSALESSRHSGKKGKGSSFKVTWENSGPFPYQLL